MTGLTKTDLIHRFLVSERKDSQNVVFLGCKVRYTRFDEE